MCITNKCHTGAIANLNFTVCDLDTWHNLFMCNCILKNIFDQFKAWTILNNRATLHFLYPFFFFFSMQVYLFEEPWRDHWIWNFGQMRLHLMKNVFVNLNTFSSSSKMLSLLFKCISTKSFANSSLKNFLWSNLRCDWINGRIL